MRSSASKSGIRIGLAMGGSLLALGIATQASAQCVPNAQGLCTVDNSGSLGPVVTPSNYGIFTLNNSGSIAGDPGISQATSGLLLINNLVGGVISGTGTAAIRTSANNGLIFNQNPPGPPLQLVRGISISNAGTINGDVTIGGTTLRNIYRSLGGTLNGSLDLTAANGSTSTFLFDGVDDGVTGTINAGNGVDYYGRSFGVDGTALLGGVLPTSFEKDAVDVRGIATVVTLRAAEGVTGSVASVQLSGNGNIVNRADLVGTPAQANGNMIMAAIPAVVGVGMVDQLSGFVLINQNPANGQAIIRGASLGLGLHSFTNEATIGGDVQLATASFVNNGTIANDVRSSGTIITAHVVDPFSFVNGATGVITLAATGARPAEIAAFGLPTTSVTIRSPIGFPVPDQHAYSITNAGQMDGIAAQVTVSTLDFVNSGTINGFGGQDAVALRIGADPYRFSDTVDAERVTILNSGTVNGDFDVEGGIDTLSFTNTGTIAVAEDSTALEFDVDPIREEDGNGNDVDGVNFTFLNSGRIDGVDAGVSFATVSVTNSGAVTRNFAGESAFEFENETDNSQIFDFTNAAGGLIANTGQSGIALLLNGDAGLDDEDGPPDNLSANVAITVNNAGQIRSDAGGTEVNGAEVGQPPQITLVVAAIGLAIGTETGGTGSVTVNNAATGVISATGTNSVALATKTNSTTIINSGQILGGAGLSLVTSDGTVRVAVVDGEAAEVPEGTQSIGEAIHTIGSTDFVRNNMGGVITGSIDLNTGNDRIENYGTINGNVFLGDGDDTFIQSLLGALNGTADGGSGVNTLQFDITGSDGVINQALRDKFLNFGAFTVIGTGGVVTEDEVVIAEGGTLELSENSVINTPGQTAISGSETTGETVTNRGTVNGNVDLRGGDNSVTNEGAINGNVSFGDGVNTVANNGAITGNVTLGDGGNSVANQGAITGNIVSGAGGDSFANAGTLAGNVDLGDGADTFANTGTVTGNVDLAGGADSYVFGVGTVTGVIAGGDDASVDSIVIQSAGQTSQAKIARALSDIVLDAASLANVTGFEQVNVNGPVTVVASGELPVDTIVLSGATLRVDAGNSLKTNGTTTILGSAGAETLTNSGAILGNVDLAGGNDTLNIRSATARFGGTVSGGAGIDTLSLATSGTTATPAEIDGSRFTGFETLSNSSGTNAVSGNLALNQINVTGGYLIGRTGSAISGNVVVGSGGTFGSAGTVTGNIAVGSGGNLAPGASPGVMTVAGNVSLATGASSTFEFVPSPGQSDQLIINGALTIATGTTINLTGNRPLTPGVSYDLITATSITGTFTTVNQASTVQGFLRYTPSRLQLLGTFVAPAGVSLQTAAAITYVNGVLTAGQGSTALLAAIPQLLDTSGTASAAAFGRLTPEAYASASQLGVEHGLSIAKATRFGAAASSRSEAGLYTFAQGLGDWRSLKGNAGTGVSRASSHSYGILGGLGFGSETGSVGAFVGYIDGRQRIRGLDASTDADGVIAGVSGHVASGGFDLTVLAAYDWGDATTRRAVPGSGRVAAKYNLRSLVLDASAGYSLPISADWAFRPELGLTHISTRRGQATETGSAAFALDVDRNRTNAAFIDGALTLRGGQAAAAIFHPWALLGLRHQLEGNVSGASAGFVGAASRFTALGAARKETQVTAGAGVSADVAPGLRLFTSYLGEFGGGRGNNVNVGARFAF